jgi:hypothetical protein
MEASSSSSKSVAFGRHLGDAGPSFGSFQTSGLALDAIAEQAQATANQFEFERVAAGGEAPEYWGQANQNMYTPANLAKRAALKRNRDVRTEIQKFWGMLPKSEQQRISKKTYLQYVTRICKALIPSLTDSECFKTAKEEWSSDARGHDEMDEATFFDAIFELTDLWTKTVHASEYANFVKVRRQLCHTLRTQALTNGHACTDAYVRTCAPTHPPTPTHPHPPAHSQTCTHTHRF